MEATPSKTLGDGPRKIGGSKDGPVLFFATKCMCQATYDLNVKAMSCDWVRPAQPADLIFLTSNLFMEAPAIHIT